MNENKNHSTTLRKPLHWVQISVLMFLLCSCAGIALFKPTVPQTHVFNHKLHTVEVGLDCAMCHYAVETNGVEQYGMLPKMADCLLCHQDQADAANCAFCHLTEDPQPFPNIPVHAHINFDHPQHASIGDMNNDCLACHSQAHTVTQAGEKKLPAMQTCLECHQDWFDGLQCLNCHNGFEHIPLEPLSEFSHTGNFTQEHATLARGNQMLCAQCHEQQYCVDCHKQENTGIPPDLKYPDNTTRNWVHEGDFITRHGIEARFNSGQCVKCHATTFCKDCHEKEGVADLTPGSQNDWASNPHPMGFGFRENPLDPNFHGRIARREIVTCAGCHDNGADTICLECHATVEKGGWGVSPHPLGFHSSLRINRDPVCLACHVSGL